MITPATRAASAYAWARLVIVSCALSPLGLGTTQTLALESRSAAGPRVAKGRTVCGKTGDSDDHRVMQGDEFFQPGTPRPQLGGGELVGPRGRAIDEVGNPDATLHQISAVLLRHRFTAVKITINDAGEAQRRIETVARVTEMRLGRGRPQTRIDSDEKQLRARANQVGNR
jgi:hypothetical protein